MTDQRPQIDLESVKDDVRYRTSVLLHLDYIRKDLEELGVQLDDHIKKDEQNFRVVHQQIGENTSGIAKGAGIVAAIVVMIGVIFSIIQLMKP